MFGGPRLVRRPLGIIHVTDVDVVFRLRRYKFWLSRAPGYLGTRDEKSGLALPSVSLFTESRFWDIYRAFFRPGSTNALSTSAGATLHRVREVLAHAYRNVDFYRKRMDECGLDPGSIHSLDDLQKLPPTTKSDIAAHFPDAITDASQQYRPWRYRSTSGTIERLTVVHDYRKRDTVRAAEILAVHCATKYRPGMKYMEIPPDVCRNVCGAANTVDPNIFRYALDSMLARKL